MSEDILSHFPIPESVKPIISDKNIEFTPPFSIKQEIKSELMKQFGFGGAGAIVMNQKKGSKNLIISGGGSTEKRLEYFLCLLSKLEVDGKPFYSGPQFDPKAYNPYPTDLLYFIDSSISYDSSADDIKKLNLGASLKDLKISPNQNLDVKDFDKSPIQLTTDQTYLIVSLFGGDLKLLQDIRDDENQEKQLFQLSMPYKTVVAISYVDTNKYEITFGSPNESVSAKVIHDIIENHVLKAIQSRECFRCTYLHTDPVIHKEFEELIKDCLDNNSRIVYSIDDEADDEDWADTRIYIFIPNITPEIEQKLKEHCQQYFEKIKLLVCKKCKMFFAPSGDEKCFRYFHKGQQIPFEDTNEMEEVDEEDGEPVVYVNYSCCGPVPKDEPPIECGKEEQGLHEADTQSEEISEFTFERCHPY